MYKLTRHGVRRLSDEANIPASPGNKDWDEYQTWLAAGNAPEPADPEPPPVDQGDLDLINKQLKASVNLMRIYCNAIEAGTYTTKTAAQTKADFKQVFDALP